MTVAELHGKLSRTGSNLHDRLEDLLTADIFGPLRYVPSGVVVLRLLQTAIRVSQETGDDGATTFTFREHPAADLLLADAPDTRPTVQFWPRLRSSEPDVLLSWELPRSGRLVVMVEVMYLSGKSGEGATEDEGQVAVFDQLGREYQDLCEHLGPEDQGVLVYLTSHHGPPAEDIAKSLEIIRCDPRAQLFWLSWVDIYRAVRRVRSAPLAPWVDDLWADIQHLLERKRLTGLRDWSEILEPGSRRQQVGWYLARIRQSGYRWPSEKRPAPPPWYRMGAPAIYGRSTTSRRSDAVCSTMQKGTWYEQRTRGHQGLYSPGLRDSGER